MKKIYLSLIAIVSAFSLSYAQTPWATSGSDIYNTNSGNVGIGTTTPGATLDVSKALGTGGANVARFFNTNSTNEDYILLGSAPASGNSLALGYNSGGSSQYAFLRVAGDAVGTGLNVKYGGNVGIGTTSPGNQLSLLSSGAGNTSGLSATNSAAGSYANLSLYNDLGTEAQFSMTGSTFTNGIFTSDGAGFAAGGAGGVVIDAYNASGAIAFGTGGLTTGNQRMTITSAGNVGIGTTAPDQLLSVNGNIHAQEILVNLTGFEDRVFKPKYHLLTLTEVKAYIDQNHHLPDVPSEAEVMKNGLKLGDMDRTLTKKVEELTLYLIEKDKEITDQNATNQAQATQLNSQKEQLIFQQKEIDELKKQVSNLIKQKP